MPHLSPAPTAPRATPTLRVGFMGLGAMGEPMAQRVLDAGYQLRVWNRTRARSERLAAQGARVSDSPAELADELDVLLSCLLSTEVMREVYLGPGGVLSRDRPGLTIVEHGTCDPALAREIAAVATERGAAFVDAPVSGGAVAAAAGTLAVMAGGDPSAEARLRELVSSYASVFEWLGPAGSGLTLKLINQMLVSTHVAIATEAAAVIDRVGIDPVAAARVLSGGWAQSTMLARCLPLALSGETGPPSDAPIGGLAEAQRLLAELATDTQLELPVFAQVSAEFAAARARGLGTHDLAGLRSSGSNPS